MLLKANTYRQLLEITSSLSEHSAAGQRGSKGTRQKVIHVNGNNTVHRIKNAA